ncbi:MAG TPA: PQQ-dependent sugar dehydrogenase, partial [Acidimicrobiia bacterium]|nr:PQQ-dependent sugar dehydrogenase [Acidimicrobiia bacterium]
MPRRLVAFAALFLLSAPMALVAPTPAGAAAPVLPANFTDQLVTNVGRPTAVASTPDGRVLIATMPGQLRVVKPGAGLLVTPALDVGFESCAIHERGMLGIAVDPAFASNHFIFVFYTFNNGTACGTNVDPYPVNRVSRFTLPDTNVVDPASELVVLDRIPSRGGGHNAGDIHFGADGLIYVSTGDGVCRIDASEDTRCTSDNNNARSLNHLLGKILRIAPDGSIPPSNPYAAAPGSRRCGDPAAPASTPAVGAGPCRETFASGLRNPFRFAVRPGTSQLYINDVGQDTWDEIDLGVPGADYGWNLREGHCALASTTDCGDPGPGLTNPIFDYAHTGGCSSITGGAFVPAGVWPSPYDGAYLFADYVCGKIFRLAPATGGGFSMVEFVTGLGASSATSMAFGLAPGGGQSLYYTTFAGGGEIRRITSTPPGHRPPTASFTTSVPAGGAPVDVAFDASASADPDGGPLSYRWDFGDGSPLAVRSSATVSHRYGTTGGYTATVTVVDNTGLESAPTARKVTIGAPDSPPTPTVVAPTSKAHFTVGQTVTLKGKATDPEDGNLPAGALTWEVL